MSRVVKALIERDEVFAEMSNLLFGDGADELVRKMSPAPSDMHVHGAPQGRLKPLKQKSKQHIGKRSSAEEQRRQKRQAQIGLASNVLGISAGALAVKDAFKDPALKTPTGRWVPGRAPFKLSRGTKLAALGTAGLQVANLGGDLVANRVLARESGKKVPKQKKKDPVTKAKIPQEIQHVRYQGRLVRVGAQNARVKGNIIALQQRPVAKLLESLPEDKVVSQEFEVNWEGEFSKVDEDKRQTFGWASIVQKDGKPIVDLQGDYISIEEIEKSAYDYVLKSRKGGNMHAREGESPRHVSDMIESFLVTDDKVEKMGLPEDIPRGWWVGFQINDDETWEQVKKGKLSGFSIHGRGQRMSKMLDS